MEEIWKDIKGYEGLYQISNLGNVKSLDRITFGKKHGTHKIKGKLLKAAQCGKYYIVTLSKNNKVKHIYIHRLVGEAFINNFRNCTDINHKDGNPKNNNVDNLEWCTRSENIIHAYRILKRVKNTDILFKYTEKRKRKVNQYDLNGNFIKTWSSIAEAEKNLKITSIGKICECCQHKRKTAFNYKWEYVNETTIPK